MTVRKILLMTTMAAGLSFPAGRAMSQENPAIPAPAAQEMPDLGACGALNDEDAYDRLNIEDGYRFIVPGKDGWLFRSGLDMKMGFDMPEERMALFRQFKEALKSRGTELIIAYPPRKGVTSALDLPSDNPVLQKLQYDPAKTKEGYIAFLKEMKRNGIAMIGIPEPRTGNSFYYKADHHWTVAGAREMAEAVADYAKTLGVYSRLKKTEFRTEDGRTIDISGTYNIALNKLCGMKVPPETETLTKTIAVSEAGDQASLFGDEPAPEVVLVGTSNSKKDDYDANFSGDLKEFLSADVLNAAISGGGYDDPMVAYLNSDHFINTPPKILIWEVPGYYDLGGRQTEDLLRQVIPAAYGDCGSAAVAASSGPMEIKRRKLRVLEHLETVNAVPEDVYLALMFEQPVKNAFKVTFTNREGSRQNFKFSRSKRYPHDGRFFYAPPHDEGKGGKENDKQKQEADLSLMSVSLNVPEGMDGMKVTARLCKMAPAQGRTWSKWFRSWVNF